MLLTRQRQPITYNRGLIAETGIIPPGLQLIQSSFRPFVPLAIKKVVVEDIDNGGEPLMRVTGLFQQGDVENANGRVYPTSILQYAVKQILEDCNDRAVLGELDHPVDAKIHLDRISHLVTKLWMEGSKVYGEAEVLDNQPHGRCLRGLFERKIRTGISSRGIGDMELRESASGKQYIVQEGYQIVTFDSVAEPSVHGAHLNMVENLNRRLRPIKEAKHKNLFTQADYESMLLDAINQHFGIKDFGPRRK